MVVIILAAFAVDPGWVGGWRYVVSLGDNFIPTVQRPFGWLRLLALLRWRRSEARILAVLTVIPMSPGARESLPLWLAPFAGWQLLFLSLSSHFLTPFSNRYDPMTEHLLYGRATALAVLWLVYVPATVFILRLPNTGPMPECVNRLTARWPRWLGGLHAEQHGPQSPER